MNCYTLQWFADDNMSQKKPITDQRSQNTNLKMQDESDGTQESNKNKAGEATDKLYTNEDVDKIINRKFAKWQAKKELEISEIQKLAELNERQKLEHRLNMMQKELDECRKRETFANMEKAARKMLYEQDINVPDELVSLLVAKDDYTTSSNVREFTKIFHSAVSHAIENKFPKIASKVDSVETISKKEITDIVINLKDITDNMKLLSLKMGENEH